MKSFLYVAAACAAIFCAPPVSAQSVAKVVGVAENGTVFRAGKREALARGSELEVGDIVRTDAGGTVQIVFFDRTRFVVGPSSRAKIDDVEKLSTTKAKKLAVRALGGTYRFLSGDSPKDAYSLRSPTGTLGIRGTEFDFAQVKRHYMVIASYSGTVQLTGRFGQKATLSGGCSAVSLVDQRFNVPQTQDERAEMIARDLPFASNQSGLLDSFQVNLRPCPVLPRDVAPLTRVPFFKADEEGETPPIVISAEPLDLSEI